MTNLTELSKRVYQLQIDKGWCKPNEKRDIEDLKILILSEAFEAFEAYRKRDHSPNTNELVFIHSQIKHWSRGENQTFRDEIKDTFEDEIADVAIRALDLAGYLNLDFATTLNSNYPATYKKREFPMMMRNFTHRITVQFGREVDTIMVKSILKWCVELSNIFDFDLMQHIELKLAYNKTRPFRHGGKVV